VVCEYDGSRVLFGQVFGVIIRAKLTSGFGSIISVAAACYVHDLTSISCSVVDLSLWLAYTVKIGMRLQKPVSLLQGPQKEGQLSHAANAINPR
jgi:hypothetical protein